MYKHDISLSHREEKKKKKLSQMLSDVQKKLYLNFKISEKYFEESCSYICHIVVFFIVKCCFVAHSLVLFHSHII